ncbi:type II secretion system protein M [Colwellia sp. KU-HH00111]|uniref:type II secretion system protein M n=1 Tax=Colwellia sp. KU-HH00111 TaxID=3127652 RepID=UPI00310A81D8
MNLASIKAWWHGLNIREQRLVLISGVCVSVFFLYSLIWVPLNDNLAKTEKTLANRQALLTWVSENTARYQGLKTSTGGSKSRGSLSSIVNRTAEQQQLTITRLQPQGDSLQVWIDSAPFNQLLVWLEGLANNDGIEVQAIDLTQGDNPGEVRVRRLQFTKL